MHNAWPGVNIDQVYAHKGYVVWQCENRGGMGRGHAFETAIYHKLGVTELADQVAGVKYLISLGFADPARIGIHGWSYGGFMTINAMLNAPDVFKAGFAGAPVTSWINYDTIYTERYMGLPKDNPDGYKDTALPPKAAESEGQADARAQFRRRQRAVPEHAANDQRAATGGQTVRVHAVPAEDPRRHRRRLAAVERR